MTDNSKLPSPIKNKYEGIGWGLFLIVFGIILAVPESWLPDGMGRLAVGLIVLFYWAAGRFHKFEVSWVLFLIGVILVASGLAEMIGLVVHLLPVLLIIGGLVLLYKAVTDNKNSSAS